MRASDGRYLARMLVVMGIVCMAGCAWACSVPVFRYALERWSADTYRLLILHRGELSSGEKKRLAELEKRTTPEYGFPSLVVKTVDLNGEIPEHLQELVAEHRNASLPWMVLVLPQGPLQETIVRSEKWTAETQANLLMSPVRQEIARRLIAGQTAVWLLMKGKEDAANKKVEALLAASLTRLAKELKLPHQMDPEDAQYDSPMNEAIELRVEFSVLPLDPRDPREATLINALKYFDPEVVRSDAPKVFPIFGRGRALDILSGENIGAEVIEQVCAFLVGPCSCQVKALNPGLDLFIPVDWDGLVSGMIGVEEALPPLRVPGAQAVGPPAAAPAAVTPGPVREDDTLVRNLALIGGIGIVVLIIGTWALLRKRTG